MRSRPRHTVAGRTAFGSSGLNNHGTFGSGVLVGQKGSSYLFTTGHITVPSKSNLSPGTRPFSFRLEFAWDTRGPVSAARDVDLELKPAPTFFVKGAGGVGRYVASPRKVLDGAFHSITNRRTGNTISITFDGITTSSFAASGTVGNSTALTIGSTHTGGDQSRAYIRNVRVTEADPARIARWIR